MRADAAVPRFARDTGSGVSGAIARDVAHHAPEVSTIAACALRRAIRQGDAAEIPSAAPGTDVWITHD
jgi:hypothetical protein